MALVQSLLPEVPPEEIVQLQWLVDGMADEEQGIFVAAYRAQREDSQKILLLSLLGFVLVAGIQRFVLGQTGMGVIYLLTGGLCGIGTIIDAINAKKMTLEYNRQVAEKIAASLMGR